MLSSRYRLQPLTLKDYDKAVASYSKCGGLLLNKLCLLLFFHKAEIQAYLILVMHCLVVLESGNDVPAGLQSRQTLTLVQEVLTLMCGVLLHAFCAWLAEKNPTRGCLCCRWFQPCIRSGHLVCLVHCLLGCSGF